MKNMQDAETATASRFGYTPAEWKKARTKFNARMRKVFSKRFRSRVAKVYGPTMQDRADRAAYAHRLITGIEAKDEGAFSRFAESVYGYFRLRGMTPGEIDRLTTEEMTRIVEDDARKRIDKVDPAPVAESSPRLVVHPNGTVLFDGTLYRFKSEAFTVVLVEIVKGGGACVSTSEITRRTQAENRRVGDPYRAIKRGETEHPKLVGAIIEKTTKGYALKVDPSAVRVDSVRRESDESPMPRR